MQIPDETKKAIRGNVFYQTNILVDVVQNLDTGIVRGVGNDYRTNDREVWTKNKGSSAGVVRKNHRNLVPIDSDIGDGF